MLWLKSKLPIIGFIGVLTMGAYMFYHILFLKTDISQGIILDKLYVPGKHASDHNVLTFARYKSNDYLVNTETHEQWLALVKNHEGDILKIHCDSMHYRIKQVGDTLHFKKYTGEILGIEYLSYYKEDDL